MSEVIVNKFTKDEWKVFSEHVHLVCFEEKRPAYMDRIDFAIMSVKDGNPLNYCTVRELDNESVYWQYGGAFPNSKGTGESFYAYQRYAKWCFDQGYKRISTYIENNNLAMMKIAMKVGFRIIGMRTFNGSILLEHYLEAPQ